MNIKNLFTKVFAALLGFSVVMFSLVIAGLIYFLISINNLSQQQNTAIRAEGIVVLTGGSERIQSAISLLKQNKAKRLLISGVNLKISNSQLLRVLKANKTTRQLFSCCVDIDRNAINTSGNAHISARWANEHKYNSIFVVTSNYHLPRAMLELSQVMPEGINLIPYAATNKSLLRPGRFILLFKEYAKYVGTMIKVMIERSVK